MTYESISQTQYLALQQIQGAFCVSTPDGSMQWLVNGKRHREDGPAVVRSCGTKEWFLYGVPHRADGPAVERSNGEVAFFMHGLPVQGVPLVAVMR